MSSIIAFLKKHPQKITGFLLALIGGIQAQAATVQGFLSPKHFALFTVCVGVFVSILGFVNTSRDQ